MASTQAPIEAEVPAQIKTAVMIDALKNPSSNVSTETTASTQSNILAGSQTAIEAKARTEQQNAVVDEETIVRKDKLQLETEMLREKVNVPDEMEMLTETEKSTETAVPMETEALQEVSAAVKLCTGRVSTETAVAETRILGEDTRVLMESEGSVERVTSQTEIINPERKPESVDTQSFEEVSNEDNTLARIDILRIGEEQENSTNLQKFSYNWKAQPKQLCAALKEYASNNHVDNFTKGCFWSPDGTCLLSPSEDFRIRIYELPKQFYNAKSVTDTELVPDSESVDSTMTAALTAKEGGIIYDTCWFPFMNSWQPETCCFLSTSKESPIHLWDAYCGILRATYRPYNQVDEVEAPLSVQFINLASEIWCGLKNCVKTFNIDRPGRHLSTINFSTDFPNMRGLVSCIRENPVMPGLTAFGTYSKRIGLYKEKPLCVFEVGSGVTQIEFSPCGTKMFTAVRRSEEFLCWDLRNPGTVFCSLRGRKADTNQRIYFNVTPAGDQVISGGTDGCVTIWDLSEADNCPEDISPSHVVRLSTDCVNGVSLHRNFPIVAVSTGQRLCEDALEKRDSGVRLWWMH